MGETKVDVVGLLRVAAIEAPLLGSRYPASAFGEARSAVAELIEAAKWAERDEYTRSACVRLRAALARIGAA